ncbi:hypothetical protein V6R21_20450 [Limibacter armeniacum]|uniref:hypothetical protein n=1 Tax=Limibacter armeniacum TaxID=466084 RepID=UPI002FE5591A
MLSYLKITLFVLLVGFVSALSFYLKGFVGALIFIITYYPLNGVGLWVTSDVEINDYVKGKSVFGLMLYIFSIIHLPIYISDLALNFSYNTDYSILLSVKLLCLGLTIVLFFLINTRLGLTRRTGDWVVFLEVTLIYWFLVFILVSDEVFFKIAFYLTILMDVFFLWLYMVFTGKAGMAGASFDPKSKILNRLKDVRVEFLYFNPPNKMKVGRNYRLVAKVGETQELIEKIEIESDNASKDFIEPVLIAKKTSVSLKGEGFEISNLYDIDVMLTLSGLVHVWEWDVKPVKKGELELRLHFILQIDYNGKTEMLEVPYVSRLVEVKENVPYRICSFILIHWKWVLSLIFGSGVLFSVIKNIKFILDLFKVTN